MTNKIMVGGVNVNECKYYNEYCEDNNIYGCVLCADISNCYFKQLKRKEQECEKKSWEIGNLGYKIKNQRREINERLKQIEKLKHKEQECEELNSDNRYFVNKIISLESLTDKYELAFKEIEKIIDNGTADTQTNNAKWLQQYYLTRFWEISNIINEVMGGE